MPGRRFILEAVPGGVPSVGGDELLPGERLELQEDTELLALPAPDLASALVHLRRPFTAQAVRFKVQSTRTEGENQGAMVVTYIDARLVVERLNAVAAASWHDEYSDLAAQPGALACALTVFGVTRHDIGEAAGLAQQKALRSDALKRAAVKFGVGVAVYAVPRMWLSPTEGLKKIDVWNPKTKAKDKKSFLLTDKGEDTCRDRYDAWLKAKGVNAFGEELDHGDVAGSQGDYEVEAATEESTESASVGQERLLTPEERAKFVKSVTDAGHDIEVVIGGIGVDSTDDLTNVNAFEIFDLLGIQPKATARAPRKRRAT